MSEKAVDSPPASESAAPATPSKGGKKMWVAIVAVIVVVALVLAGLWIAGIFGGKKSLDATISPSPITLSAGKSVDLTVEPTWGDDPIEEGTLTYRWSVAPSSLGSFDRLAQQTVEFTAGDNAGTGTVKCVVTWVLSGKTRTVEPTATLTISPPVIDLVVVLPPEIDLTPGMSQAFTATAYNSVGVELPGATVAWTVGGLTDAQYDLNATTGKGVSFTAQALGNGWLNATATDSTGSATGSATIKIVSTLPARNSTSRWYDMFEVPNEVFWDLRKSVSGLDEPLTHEYPYLTRWFGSVEGNSWIYSSMRLNFTGRNLYEVNMNDRATFLPMLGNWRGGTAEIHWYANYMKPSDYARYPAFIKSQDDGWIWILNGTVTLDKSAARTVMGIGEEDFDTGFNAWWAANKAAFKGDLTDWYNYEGKVRLDIYNAYEYPFTLMYLEVEASKVGDKIVLTYDTVSWGVDVLLSYQIWDAGVLETNWYMEDMHFDATIRPQYMNLSLDAACEYAAYAYTTTLEETPCWYWEPLIQDILPASAEHPRSRFTPYADKTYEMFSPGSPINGQTMPFDYTPVAWNLSENESLILEWPSGVQMFPVHGGSENWQDTNTTRAFGEMEIRHTEPMDAPYPYDMPPGQFYVNNVTRQIRFNGPFDMWTWSKDQTLNENLYNEWQRIGLLPYGIPTIEFALKLNVTYHYQIDIVDPIDTNTATDFTVTVMDNYNRLVPDYTGTVTFYSNDTAAVLPADYTFDGTSAVATLSVVFNTPGYRNLTAWQVDNTSRIGTRNLIQVGPMAASVALENAPNNVKSSFPSPNPFSMRVTVYDQFGNVFTNYTGTVTFSSTDADAGVVLPADFTFQTSDGGTHMFTDGFELVTIGLVDVTVTDTVDSALTDSVTIEVKPPFESTKDYKIYDMFEQPWGEWWPTRWDYYQTDIIVTSDPHMNTQMFFPMKGYDYQIIMYAPYRYNITAVNQTAISVDDPEFMPMMGSVTDGASAKLAVRFEYLDHAWWNSYWQPTWGTDPDWMGDTWLDRAGADGYDLGAVYKVTMNREAAQQWLGMPTAADPAAWWTTNAATYKSDWNAWILNEGNVRLDIYCGYEYPYVLNGATFMSMAVEGDGNITLNIGHVALGYEILMTRWFQETKMSPLEPYFEDFDMSVDYSKYVVNLSMDAVCQYSLKAVKANESATDEPAWAFEPAKIDYIVKAGHPSAYAPYRLLMYQSWNAGDNLIGQAVPYEQTPTWFNLTADDTLTMQLPTGTVPAYRGVGLTELEIDAVKAGDLTSIYGIMQNGTMDLGYYVTGWPVSSGLDLDARYNAGTKTLTIDGPQAFNNFWHKTTGVLYHGAPWIEFNVTGTKAAAASAPEVATESSSGVGAVSEISSLAVVAAATMLTVAALGACVRRKY